MIVTYSRAIVVAAAKMLASPGHMAHLGLIFLGLPAGDHINTETAVRDAVDGHRHARRDRRRHASARRTVANNWMRAVHGREAGHQREDSQV